MKRGKDLERYLIIADDFTGANDTGVQLKRRGINTNVVFSSNMINTSSDSFVIDTESRSLDGKDAYLKIKTIMGNVDLSKFKYIIKKVDSTLRGNVASEIKAVDEAYKSDLVIFAPALPDLNRTTLDGIHLLNGVPITKTEMAKDPKKPVRVDNITEILKEVYQEGISHISLKEIRDGNIDLSQYRVHTFDAVTNGDMKAIIKAVLSTGKRILWVGAAAIADNLFDIETDFAPVLSIVASLSDVSRQQVKYAEKSGIKLVQIPMHEVIVNKISPNPFIEETVKLLKDGKDTTLLSSASYNLDEFKKSVEAAAKYNMSKEDISFFTQNFIGTIARGALEKCGVSGVFITGGDTAIGFFEKLESIGSKILSEISIGVPMMQLLGGPFEGLKVVTKAGAFGKEDIIVYSTRKLKEVV